MGIAGKRVLLTTSHWSIRSGGSVQLLLLARALCEAGAQVQAVFKYRRATEDQNQNLAGLRELGIRADFLRTKRWYSPWQIAAMRRLLKQGRFDIVHTHKGGDLSLALLALRGIDLPCLVNTRGVNFRLGMNRFKYRLRRLNRIIVVSNDSKKVMVGSGVPAEKIRVVYGAVDVDRFRPLPELRQSVRDELGIPPEAAVSVVAANLVRQKGHADYLAMAAELHPEFPDLYHVFAGSGDQTELRELAANLGVADRVVFAGFRGDMERVYAAADLSVVASFAGEGVSGVLREAMACGVPVITTDVGGNAELVRYDEWGQVTPRRDPPALAVAVRRCLREPDQIKEWADMAARAVRENYSTQARADNIFAVYEEVFREKNIAF